MSRPYSDVRAKAHALIGDSLEAIAEMLLDLEAEVEALKEKLAEREPVA